MDRNEIKMKVINIISALFSDAGVDTDMLEYADLIDDLGMDSIMFISVIVEIENVFGIVISDDMLIMENFRNVDAIIVVIENSISY